MTAIEPRYGRAPGAQADVELAWASWGDENASPERTILAVHGITANLHNWDAIAEQLAAQGWRIIAFDLRGRAESSKPEHGYSLPDHATDILALLNHFRLPIVNLMGHSLGAAISVYFAVHNAERLRRLVLVDGGAVGTDVLQAISPALSRLGVTFPSREVYFDRFRNTPILPNWTAYIERYYTYDSQVNPDGTVICKVSKPAIDEEIQNLAKHPLVPLHSQIKTPTLFLRAPVGLLDEGRAGFVLTAEGTAAAVKAINDNAPAREVVVPGSNHYTIMFDASPVLLEAIKSFLE